MPRKKMTDHDSDSLLDAQLRDVPLPEGLLARVRAVGPSEAAGLGEANGPIWSDAELDAELSRVEVPVGLLARCRKVVADEPLDAALCDVSVPSGLQVALRQIPRQVGTRAPRPAPSKFRSRLVNLALALSLTALISGGYLGALAGILSSQRPSRGPQFTLRVEYLGPLKLRTEPVPVGENAVELAVLTDENGPLPDGAVVQAHGGANSLGEIGVALADEIAPAGPAAEWLISVQSGLQPWEDVLRLRYGLLGAQLRNDTLADFAAITPALSRGVEPPVVRAFDRRFLLRQGVNPVVMPAAHEALRTARVPLYTGTASFELTQRRLAEGRWPAPADVRVEEFLASVDYLFATPPPGQVGLSMSAGPSIFGQPLLTLPSASLLQVGVVAGEVPFRRLPATHLVIGLDASSNMQSEGRFDAALEAIRWLAGRLGMRDRLSLVIFRDGDVRRVEAVGRANVGELLFALEQLTPRGNMNLVTGVQQTLSLALRDELDDRLTPRVALIASGGAILPESTQARLRDLAGEAAGREVGLVFLEANRLSGGDPTLADLAAAGRGDHRLVDSADDLRWALAEALTGDAPLVAPDAVLRVTFNPRTVAGYRLLGHEPNAVSKAAPARIETDLRAGQTATALFELWLLPGTEDEVAQAEVEWRDPRTGEKQFARQSLERLQFAPSFSESPPAFQQAALAAETAEVLRESYFVQARPHSLQHVIEGAKGVSYDLAKQPEFRRFVTFLKDLEKAKIKRSE